MITRKRFRRPRPRPCVGATIALHQISPRENEFVARGDISGPAERSRTHHSTSALGGSSPAAARGRRVLRPPRRPGPSLADGEARQVPTYVAYIGSGRNRLRQHLRPRCGASVRVRREILCIYSRRTVLRGMRIRRSWKEIHQRRLRASSPGRRPNDEWLARDGMDETAARMPGAIGRAGFAARGGDQRAGHAVRIRAVGRTPSAQRFLASSARAARGRLDRLQKNRLAP